MGERIQLRRDTAANWANTNPILLQGELGVTVDTGVFKFGDGLKPWVALPLASAAPGSVDTTSYGARCDARWLSDVATTAGSAVITSASAAFVAADVGKLVSLRANGVGVTTTILSRQSATQVTLAAPVSIAKTGALAVFGSDDTVAIKAARDATPRAGTLYQPGDSLITETIDFANDITIRGRGVAENTGDIVSSTFGSGPGKVPYLAGSCFTQVTAGLDGLTFSGTGRNIHCYDFGVKFAPAIMFLNTGHGIFAQATALYGPGGHENGLFNARWDNICVFGHDGNHYAYYILNSNLGTFTHLRGHGGGGLYIESDSYGAGYGNATFVHPFFRVLCGGTAHGFVLKCRDIGPATPSLNLLTFLRPQANILSSPVPPPFVGLGYPVPTIAQYLWRNIRTGNTWPRWVDIIDPDLEPDGVNVYPIDWGGMYSGTVVRNGGMIGSGPIGGYSTENRMNPGLPLQPTIVHGPGLGSAGQSQIIEGNDQGGNLRLRASGTGIGAAGTVVATLTCPSMPPSGVKAVLMQPYAILGHATRNWYAAAINDNSKSFEIRSDTALFPDSDYQIMFQVIPRNTPGGVV